MDDIAQKSLENGLNKEAFEVYKKARRHLEAEVIEIASHAGRMKNLFHS